MTNQLGRDVERGRLLTAQDLVASVPLKFVSIASASQRVLFVNVDLGSRGRDANALLNLPSALRFIGSPAIYFS